MVHTRYEDRCDARRDRPVDVPNCCDRSKGRDGYVRADGRAVYERCIGVWKAAFDGRETAVKWTPWGREMHVETGVLSRQAGHPAPAL
jgi:hypothetical protein